MKHWHFVALASALLHGPALSENPPSSAPSPSAIVNAASEDEWVAIAPEDILVMTLTPAADDRERTVIIQLIPPPFSQGWVENIRTLARARWYDGITVNRVQDNYVVQWGDPGHDNPESGETEIKPLPEGLNLVEESEYETSGLLAVPDPRGRPRMNYTLGAMMMRNAMIAANGKVVVPQNLRNALASGSDEPPKVEPAKMGDAYAPFATLALGWPIAGTMGGSANSFWPVHCYGMVGVGRNLSPDTGTGAELYAVSGHAPRHLDRNIALVGRVISGMEHLTTLPRGSGALGFYTEQEKDLRTPIVSVRVASDLPAQDRPQFEFLSTESQSFGRYLQARANRRDPFFIVPAGGADICNVPVPIRRIASPDAGAE